MTKKINHTERAHALLSASSAYRWLACPSSAVAAAAYPQEDTPYAHEGTIAHEVAEITARRSVPQLYPDVDTLEYPAEATVEMAEYATEYADYISEQITSDDAVVLLEQKVDFSPWVPEGFGTCDCVILQGDTMSVIDYKYGKGVKVEAMENAQMKLYALGALNDFGIAYDVKRVRMYIYQPRMHNISVYETTVEELLNWAEREVKPIAQKAAKGKGGYQAGEWCRFCPHAGKCRTLTKTCTEFVETHDMRVSVPVLAPHEIAEVLRMEPLVTLWLNRVKGQALTALLDGKEIPGYKVVEGRLGNRKWTDERAVLDRLKESGYEETDVTETKLLGPAGIDKLVGKKRAEELLSDLISRSPGSPTLAPESDKRPVYDRLAEAQEDFK